MQDVPSRAWIIACSFLAMIALIGFFLTASQLSVATSATHPFKIDASSLQPGSSLNLKVDGRDVLISVPDGEGFTFGTFQIRVDSLAFASGPIERDGSLETIWVSDVNGDAKEDGVFVIRNGGSGSYVALVVLESTRAGFKIHVLPDIPPAGAPRYQGRDNVCLRKGSIVRAFPTYIDDTQPRVNRQWRIEDGANGEPPVKARADSNAEPSGATQEVKFDYASGEWKRL